MPLHKQDINNNLYLNEKKKRNEKRGKIHMHFKISNIFKF